jgi:hypothetical protein
MPLLQRTFDTPAADWPQMKAVIDAQPSDHLHVVDLPYRLCSWAFDAPMNCALWEDANGRVLAWAVFQSPFWSIDYAMHPLAPSDTLHTILAWADQRAQTIQGTPFARPMWFINGFTGHDHGQVLEDAGFHSQASVFVETDNYRDAAFNFYTAMDFRILQHVTVYRKDYASGLQKR